MSAIGVPAGLGAANSGGIGGSVNNGGYARSAKIAAMQPLSPPASFGQVEPGIYRASSALHPLHFGFLAHLRLRMVVRLGCEVPNKLVQGFFKDQGVRVVQLGHTEVESTSAGRPLGDEVIKAALEALLDRRNHPSLIMCSTGVKLTGTVVGCLRKLQNWTLSSVLEEFRAYSAGASGGVQYEHVIELFDTDLVTLPPHLPDWHNPEDDEEIIDEEDPTSRES